MWPSQRRLSILYRGSFDSLPDAIQEFVFEKNEPESKQEYYEYYNNVLSLNKAKAHLNTNVQEKPCNERAFGTDAITRITEDIHSMKKTRNYKWNLQGCLRNKSQESWEDIFYTMNTIVQLKYINLSMNELTQLPDNFGHTWTALENI